VKNSADTSPGTSLTARRASACTSSRLSTPASAVTVSRSRGTSRSLAAVTTARVPSEPASSDG
jgi:hypothetical protein